MATLLPAGEQTFLDANGNPLSGGTVTFYVPGTTDPKDTWQDSGQTTLNSNPVVLDSAGRARIYGSGSYRQVVKDSVGNLIWDQLTTDTSASSSSWASVSTGSANAQAVSASNFTFSDGQTVSFIAGYTNSSALSLNVNGAGAITVYQDGASGITPLTGGEVVAGAAISVLYETAIGAFHLTSGTSPAKVSSLILSGFAPGMIAPFATITVPSGWLKADGTAVSRSTYPNLFSALVRTSVVTISIATPGVVTWASHGLEANAAVKFTTTGALPTGLTAGTVYYVVGASITTNTFQVSATAGGSAINTSGSQSGIHTAINAPFGDGNGTTTFNLPDLRGYFIRGFDDSRGIDTARSFGVFQDSQNKTHTHGVVDPGHSHSTGSNAITVNNGSLIQTGAGYSYTGAVTPTAVTGISIASSGGSESRPMNVAMMYCIKY